MLTGTTVGFSARARGAGVSLGADPVAAPARGGMDATEIAQAKAFKARYRCGWQAVAAYVNRPVETVRALCEPSLPPVALPTAAVAERPSLSADAALKPRAAAPINHLAGPVLDAVQAGCLTAPGGVNSGFVADRLKVSNACAAIVLRELSLLSPPLVAGRKIAGAAAHGGKLWVVTQEGMTRPRGTALLPERTLIVLTTLAGLMDLEPGRSWAPGEIGTHSGLNAHQVGQGLYKLRHNLPPLAELSYHSPLPHYVLTEAGRIEALKLADTPVCDARAT